MEVTSYIRSENGNIIILIGDRQSFRCRQRNKLENDKVNSLKFVSFREMEKESKKYNKKIIGPLRFDTLARI
jgi:hypothetical protein